MQLFKKCAVCFFSYLIRFALKVHYLGVWWEIKVLHNISQYKLLEAKFHQYEEFLVQMYCINLHFYIYSTKHLYDKTLGLTWIIKVCSTENRTFHAYRFNKQRKTRCWLYCIIYLTFQFHALLPYAILNAIYDNQKLRVGTFSRTIRAALIIKLLKVVTIGYQRKTSLY